MDLGKQKRTWNGRSTRGCARCKLKRVKCDELQPCTRCVRSGASCSLLASSNLEAISANPGRGSLESETFHYFATQLAPNLAGLPDQEFWIRSVCPIAQSKSDVFNAILATSTLYGLTQAQIFSMNLVPGSIKKKYQTAIEWYSQSIKESMSQQELSVLLVGSVLYIYTEMRLAHIENAEKVARTAFFLVHSAKNSLLGTPDPVILCSLFQLLKLPVILPLRSSMIPVEYRKSVVVLALSINSRLGCGERYHLFFELMNILWDLNDTIEGRGAWDLDSRLRSYYQKYLQVQNQERHMVYTITQIQWQVFKYGLQKNRRMIEDRILYVLDTTEWWIKDMNMRGKPAIAWGLDTNIGPISVLIVWFWRDVAIVQRLRAALKGSSQEVYKDAILKYLEVLAATAYEQATSVELKLFGGQPRVIQFWHAYACTRYLAK